jgi:hypothetical protein
MKNKELYYRDRAYQLVDEGAYEGIKYFIVSYGTKEQGLANIQMYVC